MGKSHCSLGEAFVHWPVVAAAGNADTVVGWRVVDGESEVGAMQLWAWDHAELLGEFLGAVQVPDHVGQMGALGRVVGWALPRA